MSIIRRFFGGQQTRVNDPTLGSLALQDGVWTGRVTWEHSALPFALSVHRSDATPSEADRAVFEALTRNYPALQPALQDALFRLSKSKRQIDRAPQELWKELHLQGVGIDQNGNAELIFGFADPDGPGGAFLVSVHGSSVAALEYID